MHTPNNPDAATGPAKAPLQPLRKIPIFMGATLVTVIACTALGMITSIVARTLHNHQFLPTPTALMVYDCPGFATPVAIHFRHGLEVMQWHSNGTTHYGHLLNGHVDWQQTTPHTAVFDGPTELLYDDAHSIRVQDSAGLEHTCLQHP